MESRIREQIAFCGRVQGVGFRYQLSRLAKHYGVTGWVRNEYDGTVMAQLQGRPEEIDGILVALARDSYIRIDRMERKRLRTEPEERGFRIEY